MKYDDGSTKDEKINGNDRSEFADCIKYNELGKKQYNYVSEL